MSYSMNLLAVLWDLRWVLLAITSLVLLALVLDGRAHR